MGSNREKWEMAIDAGKYGLGAGLGRAPTSLLGGSSEAETVALGAVRKLVSMPEVAFVLLASELRDSQECMPFANENIFRRLAGEAGLDLSVQVAVDRRGYLHRLILCRKAAFGEGPKTGEGESQIAWLSD